MKQKVQWDAIVVGVGSMGAATCYELAARGMKVLGLEQFAGVHTKGSHSGQTRLIRQSYFEHSDYVPLLKRAYEKWSALEAISGDKIFNKSGVLYIGEERGPVLSGVLQSSHLHGIDVERVDLAETFPSLKVSPSHISLFESNAGYLDVDLALNSCRSQFLSLGGQLQENVKVLGWEVKKSGVMVRTANETYRASKLVITAGAWANQLLRHPLPIKVTRQVLAWFDVPDHCKPLPGWCLDHPEGKGIYYGFPPTQKGCKMGHHFPGIPTDPEQVDRTVSEEEKRELLEVMKAFVGSNDIKVSEVATCLYSNSTDEHFVLDILPDTDSRVILAAGFSGHGFKFVSVVGEILADLAVDGMTELPIGFLNLSRFS